jgi:hypothetical protein
LILLLAGCTAAPPPSQTSLATSLEQIVGALSDTHQYVQTHEHGGSFGLYVCEAQVNLGLKTEVKANGGVAFDSVTVGGGASRDASNSIQLTLKAPDCDGKATPKSPPLMMVAPNPMETK